MVLTSRISLLFFALTSLQVVSSTRFKIAIPVEERESMQARLAKRAGDACSDYQLVSDTSSLSYPVGFQHLRKPWDENPNTTVATSPTVTAGIDRLLPLRVPGLNGVTIKGVMDELQGNNCLSFPYGGPVRDQFLGATPADLDMETNCAPEEILAICEAAWGPSNCGVTSGGGMIAHIGDSTANDGDTDVIDASNWNETFFGTGTALEYTTNSMAYFGDGLNITIDITGNGIKDTCNKNIRIPVRVDQRQEWVSATKVYRFWKLRVKNYTAIDTDTMSFIVSEAKKGISNKSTKFQNFYCKNALTGKWMNTTMSCVIPTDSCEKALSKKEQYDMFFERDLGNFWSDTAKAFIEGLECESCSAAAGEETCGGPTTTSSTTSDGSAPTTTSSTTSDGSVPTAPSITVFWGVIATAFLVVIQ